MFKCFNKDDFRVVFRAAYATIVSIWTGFYLWNVTFAEEGQVTKFAEFIIGFVLGTLIATLINFYYGGTENAKKQIYSDSIDNGASNPVDDSVPTTRENDQGDDT